MSDAIPGNRLRSLGLIEQFSAARGNLGMYLNVCLTAEYSRRGREPLQPVIYQALSDVISKHPILSAAIIDVEKDPYFIRLKCINLDQCVTFRRHDSTQQGKDAIALVERTLQDQHNQKFVFKDSSTPFWRVCVLEHESNPSRFFLSFVFHHSIADTKSALVFHQDLECALCRPSNSFTGQLVPSSKENLLPALEMIHQLHASPAYLEALGSAGEPSDDIWSGAPQILPVYTKISVSSVSAEALGTLRRRCKEQSLTLTPTLMAIIAQAFFEVLPNKHRVIYGDCALSLRHVLPPPITDQTMGVYVTSVSGKYDVESNSLWDNARRTKTVFEKALREKGNDTSFAYLKYVPDMLLWFKEKIGRRRTSAWELSNVGALQQTAQGEAEKYKIGNIFFSQSAGACSAAIKISAATGRNGNMGLVFSWQEGVVQDEMVGLLKDRICQLMESK